MTGGLARVALTWAMVVALPSHGLAQARVDAPIAAVMVESRDAEPGPIVIAGRAEVDRLIAVSVPGEVLAAEQSSSGSRSQRRWPRRVIGGLFGGAAGFFLGGYLGAKIEGDDCNCDDPGLKGAIIGAPIGAVVGGVLGALYLF
jgi:hypothetical protein